MKNSWMAIIVILAIGFLAYSTVAKPKKTNAPAKTPATDTKTDKKTNNTKGENMAEGKYTFPGILPADQIQDKKAVIKTSKGDITFDLYADKAPKTVSNFIYLANLKFYDGLTFHRVVSGFVIQGGDPTGTGSGDAGYKFPDEPVQGDYKAGTVAMANSGPDTNGSQFFICIEDQPGLPKSYNLFGQVTSGIDVVKTIAVGDKINSITIESK